MRLYLFLILSSFCFLSLYSNEELFFLDETENLFDDLNQVAMVNKEIQSELPLLFNNQMQGGYFAMPSARMAKSGLFGFQYSYISPYQLYNLLFQLFDHLELTGNYWLYTGIEDVSLGKKFGTFTDRAANVKLALLQKQDGIPELPEFAIGVNDFMGTMRFHSWYIVATQTFLKYNLEASLGWGNGRIKGFFGGLAYSPFRKMDNPWIQNITFAIEYDANDYSRNSNEHPEGNQSASPINVGIHYRLFDFLQLRASSIRGKEIGVSASLTYNIGQTEGIFPKIEDPMPYMSPIDNEPIGFLRTKQEFGQEIAYAFQEQGFELYTVIQTTNAEKKDVLWIKLINVRYRIEDEIRKRVTHILASLIPDNIAETYVVVEADGIPIHQYHFRTSELIRFQNEKLSDAELRVITPFQEASPKPYLYDSSILYERTKSIWVLTFHPFFRSYWGSSSGKFKYDVGFTFGPQGYLFDQIYYDLQLNYILSSSTSDIGDRDLLNPSQIVNVRSDSIRYVQTPFHVEKAYLQKSINFGNGWFARLATGYFEMAYAGVATELLLYPVGANWAIGFEMAGVWKRKFNGLGFQTRVRKLEGIIPTYVPYWGLQYFLDLYYEYKPLGLDCKVSFGQFLAKDKGVRANISRTFPSGLTMGAWYTLTNGKDEVNGKRYYDKGIFFSFPLDIFLNKSSRTRLGYSMAAWLRDVGAKAATGKELYNTIYYERYNQNPLFY